MRRLLASLLFGGLLTSALADGPAPATVRPSYDGDRLRLAVDYRQWIYLTSGFDMSYREGATPGHHMFDNVFVNPEAYRAFVRTGTWPDGTMLVLESRGAGSRSSINKAGQFQDGDVMGIEVHVRDDRRFRGRWAFFAYDDDRGDQPASMIPTGESCYSCHADHAAVDNTFVQFYPTLLPIAKAKQSLSAAYRKENDLR